MIDVHSEKFLSLESILFEAGIKRPRTYCVGVLYSIECALMRDVEFCCFSCIEDFCDWPQEFGVGVLGNALVELGYLPEFKPFAECGLWFDEVMGDEP